MYQHPVITAPTYCEPIPMIDGEFDRFELRDDCAARLREAATVNFYHDDLNDEE
jgi:hypothetical protein